MARPVDRWSHHRRMWGEGWSGVATLRDSTVRSMHYPTTCSGVCGDRLRAVTGVHPPGLAPTSSGGTRGEPGEPGALGAAAAPW